MPRSIISLAWRAGWCIDRASTGDNDMMIISKDKKNEGFYAYEIHSNTGLVEIGGKFPSYKEAETAGIFAHRQFHALNFATPETPFVNDYMSLDDIFAELEA
jgi:hypothetical protein